MNIELEILRVARRENWSRIFARAYVYARHYDGLSHSAAIRAAKTTPGVRSCDIPRAYNL